MKNTTFKRTAEMGNALFLILIAVALFAALSYAVTSTTRGSGTVDRETAMISAGQMTQYPASLRTTVTRMIITGTVATTVDYVSTVAAAGVFSPAGGGASYQAPPTNIGTASGEGSPVQAKGTLLAGSWGFKDLQSGTLGYWIKGLGTDVGMAGRESFAYLNNISLAVCQQVLRGLGLAATPAAQTTAVDFVVGAGLGTATDASAIAYGTGSTSTIAPAGFTTGGSPPFYCFSNNGTYVYYHALIEQ